MDKQALLSQFREHFSAEAQFFARAPGRVNLLGEHVDYNDGPVLPAAIDRSIYLAARPTRDDLVSLAALDFGESVSLRLEDLTLKVDAAGKPLPVWASYPAGIAWSLKNAGHNVSGMQVAYTSDLPIGSGLSSSAAVEVGFGMLWNVSQGLGIDRLALARLCQHAENEYVGLACGLMDQFSSACGVDGHVLFFDTRSLEYRSLPLPHGLSIVIADSGMRRNLASSAYNERRQSCEQAVKLLRQYIPDLQSLRDVSPPEFAGYGDYLPRVVRKRAEHVVREIARVFSAVSALQRNDAQIFGALMYSSHTSLRDLYEVSLPELDLLVKIARDLPGCMGARMTGAGFGGCTVNLVESAQTDEFIDGLTQAYQQRMQRKAQVFECRASAGVEVEILGS
jgi:galactokinase